LGTGGFSSGMKRPEFEADYSSLNRTPMKPAWNMGVVLANFTVHLDFVTTKFVDFPQFVN
jgi:hypothetical protein